MTETTDPALSRDELAEIVKSAATTSTDCCKVLVEVLAQIKERLPTQTRSNSGPDRNDDFLALKRSLGADIIVSGKRETPVPPAIARWCRGELVQIEWARATPRRQTVEVIARQAGKKRTTVLRPGEDRWRLDAFDPTMRIDSIELRPDKGGEPIALGGPLAPWPPQC